MGLSFIVLVSFLLLASCLGLINAAACFLRQKSELLHHRKLIKCRPLLFYFAVHDPPDRNPGLFHFLPGGGQAVTCAGIGAARNPIDRDQVAFGDELLRHDHHIRERFVPAFQRGLVFCQADIPVDTMIDEVLGIKLVCEFESSPAEEFFECSFRECLVLFSAMRRTASSPLIMSNC